VLVLVLVLVLQKTARSAATLAGTEPLLGADGQQIEHEQEHEHDSLTSEFGLKRSGRAKDFDKLSRATSASSVEPFTLALWQQRDGAPFLGGPSML